MLISLCFNGQIQNMTLEGRVHSGTEGREGWLKIVVLLWIHKNLFPLLRTDVLSITDLILSSR
jgi:hypothetical protein